MIQIEKLHIEEFRGIRSLDLSLDSRSYVVHGPNGSGKSGVVDAIDFALTGNIARLTGPGTGAVSVLRHGPHVHQRDNPAAARVCLTFRDTDTGETATVSRTVKNPGDFTLDPDTVRLRTAFAKAMAHPELTLSRREIIKYIVTEPGTRAQEVQALLKLDHLGDVRKVLRSAQSKSSAESTRTKSEVSAAESAMARHLDLTQLLSAEILKRVNAARETLNLPALASLAIETDVKAGLDSEPTQATIDLKSAGRDVQALREQLADSSKLNDAVSRLNVGLHALRDEPNFMTLLQQRDFIANGEQLLTSTACPLCDTEWQSVEALREHLREKIARSDAAAAKKDAVDDAVKQVLREIDTIRHTLLTAHPHAVAFAQNILASRLQSWLDDLSAFMGALNTTAGVLENQSRLDSDPLMRPSEIDLELTALWTAIDKTPDQSATVEARAFITIADERWTRVRIARADAAKAAAAFETARSVYLTYCAAADETLTKLYETVEKDFSRYYSAINSDDESTFQAQFQPSAGKLDLSVDFYGLGKFPPGAYHSEGHQDGMGVCLYLALVKQLLNDDFRFAVLDDVVMSVDSSHRYEFCHLLKKQFPDVQFIITTHDETWARQMQNSGLIERGSQARFYGWNVDEGPAYEQGSDVWDHIEADLANDDIPGAAHKLRRHLEATMTDLAENLRASVPFRADGRYELSPLLSAVKGKHGTLLKSAAASAAKWKNLEAIERVNILKQNRAAAIAQDSENWAINAVVHYNPAVSLSREDFVPALKAARDFIQLFQCDNEACPSLIYLTGTPEESLRCTCQRYNLNLLK